MGFLVFQGNRDLAGSQAWMELRQHPDSLDSLVKAGTQGLLESVVTQVLVVQG